ncbi:pilin [Pseudoteredinibacter isoporae]|nr:prepilin-type N-terminal cleavage/methylation domain-containing protein [Pseudoteredinibacter isoporae]NIB23427.1 prepilin-type N-terminal cleavage/methylation domain-containing protein [Pseudoteredinibacter isoporae]
MKTVQKGFTLIELMIVVAIIGILAAVALPAYQDYTSRTKMSEPVALLSGLKIDVSAYFTDTGKLPTLASLVEYAGPKVTAGKYVADLTGATAGTFIAEMKDGIGNNINQTKVQLTFSTDANGLLVHTCGKAGSNPVPKKYLPADCRDGY